MVDLCHKFDLNDENPSWENMPGLGSRHSK